MTRAGLDDAERIFGDVDPDIEAAQVLGHPAPLLHVDKQRAQTGAAGAFAACFFFGLPLPLVCTTCSTCGAAPLRCSDEIRLAQALELRMLRMQAAQIGVGLVGEGRRLDDAARVQQLRLAVEVTAETERVGASAAGVACVFQNGETERYLGVGNLLAGELGALHQRRKAIGGRIEPPIAGTADLRMDGLGRRVEPGRGDPHGFVLELTIELGEGNAIRLIGAAQLAVGRKALRKLGGETDRRRRELRSQRLLRRRRRNASGQRQTSLLGRLGSRGGDLCICRYGMAQKTNRKRQGQQSATQHPSLLRAMIEL